MPIIQIRSMLEGQWLTAPFPPTPHPLDVVTEWRKPMYRSEFLLYPPGFMGDVTPAGWHSASNFLLSVEDSGERAEMIAAGKLPNQKTLAELFPELKRATPEALQAIGSTAVVDATNKNVYISTVRQEGVMVIGGLVLHTNAEELAIVRDWLPETAVQARDA